MDFQNTRQAFILTTILSCLLTYPQTSWGQVFPTNSGPIVNRILMLAPREYQLYLQEAERAIERGEYSAAIESLSTLLEPANEPDNKEAWQDLQEDFFIGRPNEVHFRASLRGEARRLLSTLPPRGKELYQLNFGAKAKRLLDEAIAAHDVQQLAEVSWRYFHTEAGYAATALLGRHYLDIGQPLSASICLERLIETPEALQRFEPELSVLLAISWQRSGNPQKATSVLQDLRRRLPRAEFQAVDKQFSLFKEDEDPLNWLASFDGSAPTIPTPLTSEWKMHRGTPSRNASTTGDVPLRRFRWQVPLASDPDDEQIVRSVLYDYRENGVPSVPSISPLVVDDVVLLRTAEYMLAVDFRTGKRIWEYPWAEQPTDLLATGSRPSRNAEKRRGQLEERLWQDLIHGQLSSDGRNVYLIDELPHSSSAGFGSTIQRFRAATNQLQEVTNYLLALEIGTQGKYRWRVGGTTGEDEPQLAHAFFLGPPLVLSGKLFVLAEVRGDLSLYVLDPATGQVQWSQQLAHVGAFNVISDRIRRLAGATPSYSDGVLICPTSAGAIVAVDIATRSLLWGYQYPRAYQTQRHHLQFNQSIRTRTLEPHNRWLDSTVTIGEGKVILTPLESNQMICLDLLTGDMIWKTAREKSNLLFVACIARDRVIAVGKSSVAALGLEKGDVQWTMPIRSDSTPLQRLSEQPSGRGFLVGHHYYLPTTSRILEIDIREGSIHRSVEVETPLGNLISYKNEVLSLTPEGLTTFHQRAPLEQEVADRLATNPEDAWAFEHQGLLALEDNHREEALEWFRRAYAGYRSTNDERQEGTKTLLVDTLLAAIESDLPKNAGLMAEVEPLIDRPSQREKFLRLRGLWMLESAQYADAFRAFLELSKNQSGSESLAVYESPKIPSMESYDRTLAVRRDRFVRAGIRESLRRADAGQVPQMEALIRRELDTALADPRTVGLQRFLGRFEDHPMAAAAKIEIAARQLRVGNFLQAEFNLAPYLEGPSTSEFTAQAWALFAQTMAEAGRIDLSAKCVDRIAQQWANDIVWDELTGSAWAETLVSKYPEIPQHQQGDLWPYGRVRVEQIRGNRRELPHPFQAHVNYRPVQLRQSHGALPTQLRISYDLTGTNVIAVKDPWGQVRAQLPGTPQRRSKQFVDGSLTAKSLGHLVLINFGHGVAAADALKPDTPSDQVVLWPKDYSQQLNDANTRLRGTRAQFQNNAWGQQDVKVTGRRIHTIGPFTYNGVVYLQGNSLHCVDPLTGQSFWERRGLNSESVVWGDETRVFVADPTSDSARAFDMIDGSEYDPISIPPANRRWSTVGTKILTWDDTEKTRTLRLYDPLQQSDVWQRQTTIAARGYHTRDGLIAIVEPSGEFWLIDATTGAVRIETQLERGDRPLVSIFLIASNDQYLLIRNFEPRAKTGQAIESFPNRTVSPLVDGDVHAFNRFTGESQWQSPAIVEGYGLPLDQAPNLPVLAFVRQIGQSRRGAKLGVLVLDRRDGRSLLEKDNLTSTTSYGTFMISGDYQNDTVSLRLLHMNNYQLTFTDAPQPPEPTAQTGTSSSRRAGGLSSIVGAVLDAIERKLDGNSDANDEKTAPNRPNRDPFQVPER